MPIQKSQLNILLFYQRDAKTIDAARLAFYRHKLTTNQPAQSWPSTAGKMPMLTHKSSTSCTCRGEGALLANRTAKVEQSLACRERVRKSLNQLHTLERNSGCEKKW